MIPQPLSKSFNHCHILYYLHTDCIRQGKRGLDQRDLDGRYCTRRHCSMPKMAWLRPSNRSAPRGHLMPWRYSSSGWGCGRIWVIQDQWFYTWTIYMIPNNSWRTSRKLLGRGKHTGRKIVAGSFYQNGSPLWKRHNWICIYKYSM